MILISARDELATYRYLRIALPILVVLLGAAVVNQIFAPQPDCWLGSISAYYYTPVRAVFVACLCSMGTCLIVYHGNTPREDFVLNLSGFLAFMVALVPTPLAELVINPNDPTGPAKEPTCKRSNVPSPSQLNAAIDNNIWALLVAATVVLVVILWFRSMSGTAEGVSGAVWLLGGLLVLGWGIFLLDRPLLREQGHLISAVTMFAGIVLVVMLNAIPWDKLDPKGTAAPPQYLLLYRIILIAMLGAVVIIGFIALLKIFDHAIFWLEASLIVLFAAFWVVQTKELWEVESRT